MSNARNPVHWLTCCMFMREDFMKVPMFFSHVVVYIHQGWTWHACVDTIMPLTLGNTDLKASHVASLELQLALCSADACCWKYRFFLLLRAFLWQIREMAKLFERNLILPSWWPHPYEPHYEFSVVILPSAGHEGSLCLLFFLHCFNVILNGCL